MRPAVRKTTRFSTRTHLVKLAKTSRPHAPSVVLSAIQCSRLCYSKSVVFSYASSSTLVDRDLKITARTTKKYANGRFELVNMLRRGPHFVTMRIRKAAGAVRARVLHSFRHKRTRIIQTILLNRPFLHDKNQEMVGCLPCSHHLWFCEM